MTKLAKVKYLRKDFVHKFQDGNGRNRVHSHFKILEKYIFLKFHLGYQVIKITTKYHNCIWYSYHSDICLDYPKLFQKSGI